MSGMKDQEQLWCEGIRAGHLSAFDALYTAVVPSLLIFARRLAAGHLAEEAVQDVMLDVWERRETLEIRGSVRAYLFGAVRLRIADRLRREKVAASARQTMAIETDPMAVGGNMPTLPSADLEARELREAIQEALTNLPPQSRMILTLRWVDGMTYPEIAAVLGISVDAAKKQGRRMEVVLRVLLARFAPE